MTTDLVQQGHYVTSFPQIRKKFLVFIRNRKVHYCVRSNPPPAPVFGQQSATRTCHHISLSYSSIILHTINGRIFQAISPLQILPNSKFFPVCHACHMPRSSDVLNLIIAIISGKGDNHKAVQYAIFSNLLTLPPSLWI